MKYIKLLLISFIAFFILFTLIGLLFPSTVRSVKALVVNKPLVQVRNDIQLSENWMHWYPYFMENAGASIRKTGNDFIFSNDKKDLLLSMIKTDSNSLSFTITAWNGTATEQQLYTVPINGDSTHTQVIWNETEHLKWYPWERFRGLLLERTKGVFLDSALNRFKRYEEAR
ncbi:MAG: hypothetical protein U0V75_07950 [Ferruginibacter sp.]